MPIEERIDLKFLLNETVTIALAAFKIIEEQKETTAFSAKADSSLVSEADINTEKFIREALQKLTPDIPVFGEELGCEGIDDTPIYWLIDPIDGTAWYRLDVPIYGSLIALIVNGEPVIGTVGLPALNQLCYAAKGEGCYFYDNNKIEKMARRSDCVTNVSDAIVTASGIHGSSTWLENGDTPWALLSIIKSAKLFKFSGDCIQHIALIRGKADASIDTIMKPWDSAPLIICLREAGVFVSDLNGNDKNLLQSNHLLSACNAQLGAEIIKKIAP